MEVMNRSYLLLDGASDNRVLFILFTSTLVLPFFDQMLDGSSVTPKTRVRKNANAESDVDVFGVIYVFGLG